VSADRFASVKLHALIRLPVIPQDELCRALLADLAGIHGQVTPVR
jgi:hypothetical protein